MKTNNKVKMVMKKVMHNSTITMMSLASLLAVVRFGRCFLFLGEVKQEEDVNKASIRELRQYMKEIKK